MDELMSALLSAELADVNQAGPWFAFLCQIYGEAVAAGEESWESFRERVTAAAAEEGFSAEAEKFAEYMSDATPEPLAVVAAMNEQGADRLAEMYAEGLFTGDQGDVAVGADEGADEGTAPAQAADDSAAWNAFLAANGRAWDGTEESWNQFREWFLYTAEEAGVKQAADGFISYVEAQQDKIEVFAQYGITVGPATDPSSFPSLSPGDSGEWVDYLDRMLQDQGF